MFRSYQKGDRLVTEKTKLYILFLVSTFVIKVRFMSRLRISKTFVFKKVNPESIEKLSKKFGSAINS